MMRIGIFEERDKWGRPIALSAALHLLLAITIVVAGLLHGRTAPDWGGDISGGSVTPVGIVDRIPVPLPEPQNPTQSVVATENTNRAPAPPAQPHEDLKAIPIPEQPIVKHNPPKPATTAAPPTPRPITPPADNTVGYGDFTKPSFTAGNVQGGFNFQGDFGSRFAWYVNVIKNTVSSNWYPGEIGAGAQGSRAFVSFDITRDGTPTNVKLEQSSGIPALDQSALRALQRIDGFGRLPAEYSGSYLHVELWFNPQR